jgi:hypothetical protein
MVFYAGFDIAGYRFIYFLCYYLIFSKLPFSASRAEQILALLINVSDTL